MYYSECGRSIPTIHIQPHQTSLFGNATGFVYADAKKLKKLHKEKENRVVKTDAYETSLRLLHSKTHKQYLLCILNRNTEIH